MLPSLAGFSVLLALSSPPVASSSFAGRIEPGKPISPNAPWAIAPEGPRSHFEELFGESIDPTLVEPIWDGNLMYDGESLALSILEEQGLPIPALDHDPTPGVLYLAMDGVTLRPKCNGYHPQQANAALNCSPLVSKETAFPAVQGGENTKAVVLQELRNFYKAYNLVITTNRPPDWLPYTMAVVGGTSSNAGQPGGVCGIANVACDGAKRNHVSLTFPNSCVGVTAEVAAQETAHNWGLEHTDVQADLMYPFVAGANAFRDECMDISHATGNGVTQCTYVHKLYCPEGQGEQQNSHTELLGVFGPREEDNIAPEIVSISPPDGSVFTTADSFLVTAQVTDNSNFVGAKWTWLEGLPPDFEDTGYHRCTNDVCLDKYGAWKSVESGWELVNLNKPPAGTYKFMFEVMDAYGNSDSETITITVVDPNDPGDPTEGPTSSGGGESGGGETGGGESGGGESGGGESGGGESDGGESDGGSGVTGASGTGGATATEGEPIDGDDGCNCRTGGTPSTSWLLLLAPLLPLRRRRRDR